MSMDDPDDVRAITRQQAASQRVDYGNTVLLHESSRRRVILVPFFIPRTAGTELSVKIQSYEKGVPPFDWVLLEEKSVALNEPAARRLLAALKNLFAVAEQDERGSYLVVRVTEGTAQLGDLDPAMVTKALTKVLAQQEIVAHLANTELTDELVYALRGAIRLHEMAAAVAQLRQYLDEGEDSEEVYQLWCEEHSWAFGNAYVIRDNVREISPGDKLDLLLPTVISGFRDLVELKRPGMEVLRWDIPHRNYYFSADVSRAIGQCHRYLDVLHEEAAKGLRDHPEVVAYHPRAIIVIGRSADWNREKLRALHGLNSRLSSISVMTYDQLLNQGERLISILRSQAGDDRDREPEASSGDEDDDDVPF